MRSPPFRFHPCHVIWLLYRRPCIIDLLTAFGTRLPCLQSHALIFDHRARFNGPTISLFGNQRHGTIAPISAVYESTGPVYESNLHREFRTRSPGNFSGNNWILFYGTILFDSFVRFSEVWEIDFVDKFEDVFMGSSYRGQMFNIFQLVYFVLSNSVF